MNNMVFTFEVFDPSAIRVVEGCLATLRSCLPHALAEIRIQERRAHDADGTMTVNSKSSDEHYVFEAKTRIESSTLGMAVGRAKDYAQEAGARPLILAMYINDTIAGRISESGIDYIDSVGNISINSESVVVRSRGGKPPAKSERVQRAFQSSGLQVIAVLLAHPYAVNWTYRRLAEEAGVSLGSISHVLGDLRHAGYVKLVGPRQNRLMNRRDLFDKWEFAYASRVRPSLNPHRFRLADQAPLEQLYERIANSDEGILIGGELATAMAMKHLRPERATIHTPKGVALRKLQTLLKLVPDPEGYVEVIDRFEKGTSLRWPGPDYRALIHPLLVHAEIIRAGADDRLREAAREVFDQFIGPVLDDETVHQ
jgi:hypothetical protein